MKLTTIAEVLNFYNSKKHIDNLHFKNPFNAEIKEGCSHFVLSQTVVKKECDLSIDGFSPWSGKGDSTKRVTSKSRQIFLHVEHDQCMRSKERSEITLKLLQNTHASYPGLRRTVYIFKRGDLLIEPVLYVYESTNTYCSEQVVLQLPSDLQVFKKALEHRTTTSARSFLQELGYEISSKKLTSLSRSVPSHIKTKKGLQVPLDITKILDRYISNIDSQEILDSPVIEREGESVKVRIMVCYPLAIKCYASGLPMRLDILEYQQDVRNVLKTSEENQLNLFNEIVSSTTPSGSVPCIGSAVMVDTTFSLSSSEYVTIMLGINDVFKSKQSHKNHSVILGFMIHSKKEMEDHEMFAMFMNRNLTKFAGNKAVGLLIHDGESSFKVYNTGSFLKDAILIRCDAHRLDNVKDALRKDPQMDYEELKHKLYGQKQNFQGLPVLRKGIMQNMKRDVFDDEFDELVDTFDDGYFKSWMKKNKDDFFNHNSMFSKLLGGWPLQFLTTNVIESRNASIKLIISHRKPAEKILEDFLNLHKDEMNERLLCISGKPSKIESDASWSMLEWVGLTIAQRRALLFNFGLDDLLPSNILESIPLFLLPSKKIDVESYCKAAENLEVFRLNESFFVLNNQDRNECVNVVLHDTKKLVCYSSRCKQKVNALKLCIHRIVVLNSLMEDEKNFVLDDLEKAKTRFSSTNVIRGQMRPDDGTKYKRKGKQLSKNNNTRTYVTLVNHSLELTNSYNECPEDIFE